MMSSTLTSFRPPERTEEQWAAIRAENERIERAERERERLKRVSESRIPSRYIKADISTCCEAVCQWSSEPTAEGLLLQGDNGIGKTHAACAVLLDNAETRSIMFATMKDIIDDCKASFQGRVSERDVIAKYTAVGMLVIDDVGKEHLTEWSLPIFFSVIDKRYSNMRPTIITTNCDGKQLFAKFVIDDDRSTARAIISRLGTYTRVRMTGGDRRH